MGKTIGIDLGTTNSVATIYENGNVRILPTSDREPLMPSVISYEKARYNYKGEKILSGRILVGRSALNNFGLAPKDTIISIKRLIGRPIVDKIVRKMIADTRFTYQIEDNYHENEDDHDIYVVINEERYTPVDISAMILQQIKADAEAELGEEVTHAVITAPTHFGDRQRRATFKAGQQAGLKVKQILSEPTAAALGYGYDFKDDRHFLLVFDMGGGTTDISVVQSANKRFKVLGQAGDMWLGGDDFDQVLIDMIIAYVENTYDYSPTHDAYFAALAKRTAEAAKKQLSISGIADISIPNAITDPIINVFFSVERQDFEKAIQDHIDRAEKLIDDALADAELSSTDITNVLMVGGSTFIPAVQRMLKRKFNPEIVQVHHDPTQAVAHGAGLVAAELQSIVCPNCEAENDSDNDVCRECGLSFADAQISSNGVTRPDIDIPVEPLPRTIGIGVAEGNRIDIVSPIIEKGTPVPLMEPIQRTYYTTAGLSIVLPIYEGNSTNAHENDLQALIEIHLPSMVRAGSEIEVFLNVDQSRLLTVRVKVENHDVDTGDIEIHGNVADAGKIKSLYPNLHRNLEKMITIGKSFLENYGNFLDLDRRGTRGKIEDDLRQAEDALKTKNLTQMENVYHRLERTIQNSGIASSLFIANIIIMQVSYNQEVGRIRQTIEEIKKALENGDREQVQLLKTTIDTFNHRNHEALKVRLAPQENLPTTRRQ